MADKKGLFDHIKQVKKHKRDGYWEALSDDERGEWSSWMVHRFISMEPDYLPMVNQVQHLTLDLDDEVAYTFWVNALPRDPRYAPYVKASGGGNSVPDFILSRLAEYHMCSRAEAREYLRVFTSSPERLGALRDTLRKFALTDNKREELDTFIESRG